MERLSSEDSFVGQEPEVDYKDHDHPGNEAVSEFELECSVADPLREGHSGQDHDEHHPLVDDLELVVARKAERLDLDQDVHVEELESKQELDLDRGKLADQDRKHHEHEASEEEEDPEVNA